MNNEDLAGPTAGERFRVAVVVFVDLDGDHHSGAGFQAEQVVRHALSPEHGRLPVEHRVPRDHGGTTAHVVAVRSLTSAIGGGYLGMEPTGRAWQ